MDLEGVCPFTRFAVITGLYCEDVTGIAVQTRFATERDTRVGRGQGRLEKVDGHADEINTGSLVLIQEMACGTVVRIKPKIVVLTIGTDAAVARSRGATLERLD